MLRRSFLTMLGLAPAVPLAQATPLARRYATGGMVTGQAGAYAGFLQSDPFPPWLSPDEIKRDALHLRIDVSDALQTLRDEMRRAGIPCPDDDAMTLTDGAGI